MNNPLKYTDPSGYFVKGLFRAVKRAVRSIKKAVKKHAARIVGVALFGLPGALIKEVAKVPVLNTIASIAACTLGGSVGCAAYSFASTYANTGSLSQSFRAGATSYFTARASSHIKAQGWSRPTAALAHGAVGGFTSVVQGGKFGQGFASSYVTKRLSWYIRGGAEWITGAKNSASRILGAASAAITGGTISKLGGGKFANGAQTAAIQYLFAETAQKSRKSTSQKLTTDEVSHQETEAMEEFQVAGVGLVSKALKNFDIDGPHRTRVFQIRYRNI